MALLNKIERKLGKFALHQATLYLIGGQVLLYLMALAGMLDFSKVFLVPRLVMAGEYWRLFTFLVMPPSGHMILVLFGWYLFWLMGTALEGRWGAFRYNLFLLAGWALNVGAAFLTPSAPSTNLFLGGSVFLAFAWLYPDFVLYIFFIIPVRIKWLALVTWIGYGWQLLFGTWSARLLVLASTGNFLLFFGRDLAYRVRTGRRRMTSQVRSLGRTANRVHQCRICLRTSQSHPDLDFRYCTKCDGSPAYCSEHIAAHQHVEAKTQ